MDNRPIGVFDSGLGGITVLNELKKLMPNENYIYLGDTLNFPYGNKTKEDIIKFSDYNTSYLLSYDVKMIIIACGTATSQAIQNLESKYDTYIEGIILPTVDFVKNRKISKIGVMGTVGTIKNGAWEKYLKEQIPKIEVINQSCPLLAEFAENGKISTSDVIEAIHNYMKIFKENNVNTIILGCTHYPYFEEVIKKEFDYSITLINTGKALAKKVYNYLNKNNMLANETNASTKIIVSKKEEMFEKSIKKLLKSTKKLDITTIN